jgi:hypothetical protein
MSQEKPEPDRLSYARAKLEVAVWKLAIGTGDIKSRLADAFYELAVLRETDFPSDLRDEWKQIISELTSGKMQYDITVKNGRLVKAPVGSLHSTLRFMQKSRAKNIAEQIWVLDSKLRVQNEIHNEE